MIQNKIIAVLLILLYSTINYGQTLLGEIQDNTNLALPSSYNFKEYVFAEPDDQGDCSGATNATASIDKIFFAQTHRRTLDHPFHFLIGHRPSLFQLSILGSGNAPDVKLEGFMNGVSLGSKCLNGPATLSENIDTTIPDFEKYFSVTLPKSWIQIGLTLKITMGTIIRNISAEELKIGPYTEMNIVQYDMDVLDYNTERELASSPLLLKPANFLQEIASSIPASVIRYGTFPEKLVFPELIATNGTEQLVRLSANSDKIPNGVDSDGSINSVTSLLLASLHKTSGDYLSTFYFGNTMNLRPGGWGGGKSLVSPDFDDVFKRSLSSLVDKGDLLWCLSTSGKSKNILKVLKYAKQNKIQTIGFLGNNGGEAKKYVDLKIIVPSKNTARIQEIHQFIGHFILEQTENLLIKNYRNKKFI